MARPPDRGALTLALVAMLAEGTGRPVGKGDLPSGDDVEGDQLGNPVRAYSIVTALTGGQVEEGWDGQQKLIAYTWQVTAVADDHTGCEHFSSVVHDVILGRDGMAFVWALPAEVDGLQVPFVSARRMDGPPSEVDQVGNLFQTADRYQLIVSV